MSASVSSRIPPALIIAGGCIIAMVSFGPRSAMGLFQQPVIGEFGWGRDVFSLALAVQNLVWGMGQPFMGAIADRFGTVRVLVAGLVVYALGLGLMTVSASPLAFDATAGVLIGLGLSGSSFNIVLAAFGKLVPPEKRSLAFGFGTAAGSFGQFLFSPLGVGLIDGLGWRGALLVFAVLMLIAIPLTLAIATPPAAKTDSTGATGPGIAETIRNAFSHKSYVFLVLGFFTCGFQLAFITVHLPSYFNDVGLSVEVGGLTLAAVGLFNIAGSIGSGWLGARVPKRYILAVIYIARSVVTVAMLLAMPFANVQIGGGITVGAVTALLFGASMGLLWLSTVPPTAGLVGLMFGTRSMAMLYGFAFFSHQVGGFIGVLLGGYLFEATGSYSIVWWLSILLGIASALINLPIEEAPAPAERLRPA